MSFFLPGIFRKSSSRILRASLLKPAGRSSIGRIPAASAVPFNVPRSPGGTDMK